MSHLILMAVCVPSPDTSLKSIFNFKKLSRYLGISLTNYPDSAGPAHFGYLMGQGRNDGLNRSRNYGAKRGFSKYLPLSGAGNGNSGDSYPDVKLLVLG